MVVTHSSLDALVTHLERLDAVAVVAMAEEAVGAGQAVSEVIGSLLLPAWRQLEQRADDGEVDEATIGAATDITRRALARVTLVAGGATVACDRPPVMVVSSSTGADLLGADVVCELVTAAGWPVDVLSGSSPTAEIVAQAQLRRPAALIVTYVETADLAAASQVIAAAHSEHIPVIAWGPAFGPDATRTLRLGAEVWAGTLDVVTTTLESWWHAAPALLPSPEVPDGLAQLHSEEEAVLRAATTISGWAQPAVDWAALAARHIIDHLGAAVLVGDSSVLDDHIEAERRGLARHQLLDVHLLGLIEAMVGAMAETTQPARSYMITCRDHVRRALVSGRPRPTGAGTVTVSSRPARGLVGVAPGPDPSPATRANGQEPQTSAHPGQPFTDLLLLAALACQTPFAMISVPRGDGQWTTLSYGFEQKEGLNDPRLFDYVAARSEPTEIRDLSTFPGLAGCPLATAPHNLRWVYATPVRDSSGTVLGVVAVLDRWLREASRREQRAMQAVTRQMVAHLSLRRRPAGTAPRSQAAPGWTAAAPGTALVVEPAARTGPIGLRRAASLPEGQQLLRSHEVAVLFDVTERTVINWAAAGKLPSLRTIGGHLRFHREDVLALLAGRTSGQRPAVGN